MSKTSLFLTTAAWGLAPTVALAHGGHSPAEDMWHVVAHIALSTRGIMAIAVLVVVAASGAYLRQRGK